MRFLELRHGDGDHVVLTAIQHLGQLNRRLERTIVIGDAVHEPDRERFVCVDTPTRQDEIHGSSLAGTDTAVVGAPLPYPDAHFDAVVSMDVVEHLSDPVPWLEDALRVVKPGGLLFLTTPNYASRSLRVLEDTALEIVARVQGFSRKELHPTKLDRPKLQALLTRAGARNAVIKPISLGWVLAAYAWR